MSGGGHPLRPGTAPRYHARFDPPPLPTTRMERCHHCGEMVLKKPDQWLEATDDEALRPHAHQPPPPPPPPRELTDEERELLGILPRDV